MSKIIWAIVFPVFPLFSQIPNTAGWHPLPNTKLRAVAPPNNFGGSTYGFASFCGSVASAWNSGVFDTKRNRLVVWGGGHSDYYGNEIYALGLDSLKMRRLTDPGLPLPSTSDCYGGETAANGTQPGSRHTYDGIAYLPNVDRMFVFSGSTNPCGFMSTATWTFDFTGMKWERRHPTGTAPQNRPGVLTAYDPNTGKVFLCDESEFYSYDFAADKYTQLSTGASLDYHLSATLDPVRKKFVIAGMGKVWFYDIGPGSNYKIQALATTGGGAVVSGAYPGLAYDERRQCVVGWSGGSTVYSLDFDNKVWTTTPYTGGPGNAMANGTYDRWSYSPEEDAFVIVNSVDNDAWAFRFPGSTGREERGKGQRVDGKGKIDISPNPVRSRAVIRVAGVRTDASVQIFDPRGNRVAVFSSHNIEWRPGALPAGVYLLKVQSGSSSTTRKLLIEK